MMKDGEILRFQFLRSNFSILLALLLVFTFIEVSFADRFLGSGFDGYDVSRSLQSYYGNSRFTGSGFDGYDNSQTNAVNFSFALTVESAYGGQSPGTTTNLCGSVLSLWVTNSPVGNGTTQYVGNGGVVLGNDFSQVNSTNITLTLTNHAVLTWGWATNYWLDTGFSGSGGVDVADSWMLAGSSVAITAIASNNWHFASWSGETGGCGVAGNVITAAMSQARAITANFEIDMFSIVASSGANGVIAPSGTIAVAYGANTNFVITPDAFYHIVDVTVDSSSVGPSNVYMFVNVTNNHSILSAFGANMTTNGKPTPEWWLNQYYGVTDYTAVAEEDTDGDGVPTWAEYIAGTDPTNRLSVLAVTMPDLMYGTNYFEAVTEDTNFFPSVLETQRIYEVIGHKVSWYSVTGRVYNLMFNTNLASNAWLVVDGASNIAATPPQNTFTNETACFSNELIFYRVKVNGP